MIVFFISGMLGFGQLGSYPVALGLVALGAAVAHLIVANLPPGDREHTFL